MNGSIAQSKYWRKMIFMVFVNLLTKNEKRNIKWPPYCSKTGRIYYCTNGTRMMGKIVLEWIEPKNY